MGVEFTREGNVAKVGLNTPGTKNALGCDTLLELFRVWEECRKDDAVRAVVFYSALPRPRGRSGSSRTKRPWGWPCSSTRTWTVRSSRR
jgi:1,4-dihydroxy-2-naphthoyl-CoA synthase